MLCSYTSQYLSIVVYQLCFQDLIFCVPLDPFYWWGFIGVIFLFELLGFSFLKFPFDFSSICCLLNSLFISYIDFFISFICYLFVLSSISFRSLVFALTFQAFLLLFLQIFSFASHPCSPFLWS